MTNGKHTALVYKTLRISSPHSGEANIKTTATVPLNTITIFWCQYPRAHSYNFVSHKQK